MAGLSFGNSYRMRRSRSAMADAEGERAEPAEEHQGDQHELRGRGQVGGDAGGQPDRGEGGDALEQRPVEVLAREEHQQRRAPPTTRRRRQYDGDRLPVHRAGEALAEDVDGALAAQLGHHDEEQHREGRHFDAAGGAGGAAADEHQDVHAEPASRRASGRCRRELNPAVRV